MAKPTPADLAAVAAQLADWAAALAQESGPSVASTRVQWIDQRESQLGKRRQINAVRLLVAKGSPDARIVARRHLLTAEAHEAELLRIGTRKVQQAAQADEHDEDIGAELGLRIVGGRK